MKLSVLDQSTIVTGRPPAAAIQESLALARHAEALGFHRYWCAEHHNSDSIAGSAPEVLMAAIAATTSRIRVGSAGIMLPHYASLKVAEQFRVLDAIAPGRIDVGVGRAPGSDQLTAHALNPNAAQAADMFPTQIRDLDAWLHADALPDGHPFRSVTAQPTGDTTPELWILGSSEYGAQVAAYFGLPYCYAHFITDGQGAAEALSLYRQTFRPSPRNPQPHAALCVWALAAPTQAEAEHHFASREAWRLNRDRGRYLPLPSPAEALAAPRSEDDRRRVARLRESAIYGTPDLVAERLHRLASHLGADELAVLTTVHDPAIRQHSYTLLARSFGLDTGPLAMAAE